MGLAEARNCVEEAALSHARRGSIAHEALEDD